MTALTLQPGAAGNDCELREESPTTNFNTDSAAFSATVDNNNKRQYILEFDASAIPSGSTINDASLTLNITFVLSSGLTYKLTRLTQSFTEALATYNTYNGSDAWPGGAGAEGDTDDTYALTGTYPSSTGSWSLDVKNLVQDAVDNRSGIVRLIYYPTNEIAGYVALLDTSELSTEALRPKIVLNYTAPTGTSKAGGGFAAASHFNLVTPKMI